MKLKEANAMMDFENRDGIIIWEQYTSDDFTGPVFLKNIRYNEGDNIIASLEAGIYDIKCYVSLLEHPINIFTFLYKINFQADNPRAVI